MHWEWSSVLHAFAGQGYNVWTWILFNMHTSTAVSGGGVQALYGMLGHICRRITTLSGVHVHLIYLYGEISPPSSSTYSAVCID